MFRFFPMKFLNRQLFKCKYILWLPQATTVHDSKYDAVWLNDRLFGVITGRLQAQ